ncbi:hypothetical protein HN51_028267 [Arachis hypogaea]
MIRLFNMDYNAPNFKKIHFVETYDTSELVMSAFANEPPFSQITIPASGNAAQGKDSFKKAPGAVANRVALEACVQARNEGRDLAREGNEIIREASKWSPELAAACEVWKAIKFEFPAMDIL